MGVVTDRSLQGLTTAVQGISTSGMSDSTGQAINTTLQSLVGAISPAAANVTFDNTGSELSASNVQAALVELDSIKQDSVVGGAVSAINFNDYKTQGNYWVNAANATNAPTTGYCYLEVVQTGTTNCMQRVTKYATSGANMGITWVRWFGNNQWYAWTLIAGQIWEYDSFNMGTQTINQNNRGVFTKNVAKTGYTPVGIVEIQLTNNWMYVGSFMISSNTAQVVIHNINTSDSQTVNIKVLYRLT